MKEATIGIGILSLIIGIIIGGIMCNTLGNTTITTNNLDNVCIELYGEGHKYADTRFLTEDSFNCVKIFKEELKQLHTK